MSALIPRWTPFQTACRLRSLQQGANNVGNTQQNIAALYALAVTNANGAATWAKWRSAVNAAQTPANLLINVKLAPNYVAPPGTYGNPLNSLAGQFTVTNPAAVHLYEGTWQDSTNIFLTGSTDVYGWDSVGNNLGTVSPGNPVLPNNTTPVVSVLAYQAVNYVAIVVSGTVPKAAFGSIKMPDGTVLTTAAAHNFTQAGGYSGWVFQPAANQMQTVNKSYAFVLS